jgi:SAM-dependent methyltransferase
MARIPPDVTYTLDQFRPPHRRDELFHLRRLERAVLASAGWPPVGGARRPRVLDVACGAGRQTARLGRRGWEAWGVDASDYMLQLGRYAWDDVRRSVAMVRGLAETLPFRDAAFDLVICQGSLDHFAEPSRFVAEAERVLAPDGRLIVALANYESLACRLGRNVHRLAARFGLSPPRSRQYWHIPADHTFRGSYRFLTSLGEARLELSEVYGVSLLQCVSGWRALLHALPPRVAAALWRAGDRVGYHLPVLADSTVAVWRRRVEATAGGSSAREARRGVDLQGG